MDEIDDTSPKMWYEEVTDAGRAEKEVSEELLIKLKTEAETCLSADTANYNIKNSRGNSNYGWMKTVMSKGITSDKVAAYVVMIQNNPIYTVDALTNLVGMVKVGKKHEFMIVIDNLVQLFLENLLIPHRKLLPFRLRPLDKLTELSSGNVVTRRKLLSHWIYEQQLKEIYTSFVLALNMITHDTVEKNKEKAISALTNLLAGNSEQEQNLLKHIVNKLGDPSKKIASKVIYCLSSVLNRHSNMQGVVLNEIEKVLFRTNISPRAQYYALCFLSQFYLNRHVQNIAEHLIDIYFSFFKACVKKGEVNTRMMSVLLMGVNRAFPYAQLEADKLSEHIDTMYRIVHVANFNVSLHALRLLYQVSCSKGEVNDRFVSALYRKLPDPHITNTFHQAILLGLVYKTLVCDKQIHRLKVLIKRLLQIAIYSQPSMACGVLYIISQILRKNRSVLALVLPKIEDNRFVDDDDEEKYFDIDANETTEEGKTVEIQDQSNNDTKPDSKSLLGWLHKKKTTKALIGYNGLCRNPLYAGGEYCAYTELNILKNHFHPTVALFATNLLNAQVINYSGDPLKDFSLIRFLDRFVFKNPKRPQDFPKEGLQTVLRARENYRPRGIRAVPVQSSTFLNNQEADIPIEERFLYTYLLKRNQGVAPADNDDDESDSDSVASDEFNEMLDKMIKTKGGDEDPDYMEGIEEGLKSSSNKKNRSTANKTHDDQDEVEEEEEEEEDEDEYEEDESEIKHDDEVFDDDYDDEDDNDSEILFNSDDETGHSKQSKKGKFKDTSSLFASAEEFASLLEDEGASKIAPGGSNAWSNKDNAHLKQIAWEDKRDQWLKGYGKTIKKNDKYDFKSKKSRINSKNKQDFKHKTHKRKSSNPSFQNKKKKR